MACASVALDPTECSSLERFALGARAAASSLRLVINKTGGRPVCIKAACSEKRPAPGNRPGPA